MCCCVIITHIDVCTLLLHSRMHVLLLLYYILYITDSVVQQYRHNSTSSTAVVFRLLRSCAVHMHSTRRYETIYYELRVTPYRIYCCREEKKADHHHPRCRQTCTIPDYIIRTYYTLEDSCARQQQQHDRWPTVTCRAAWAAILLSYYVVGSNTAVCICTLQHIHTYNMIILVYEYYSRLLVFIAVYMPSMNRDLSCWAW